MPTFTESLKQRQPDGAALLRHLTGQISKDWNEVVHDGQVAFQDVLDQFVDQFVKKAIPIAIYAISFIAGLLLVVGLVWNWLMIQVIGASPALAHWSYAGILMLIGAIGYFRAKSKSA